ncbi:ABC transporter ATP-binding protein [Halobacteriales archaeon QS_1_68_17]|nr:MAG: ABC transporter ATP-binding protein [Halobacteriales archaeon QS_1_68_17]
MSADDPLLSVRDLRTVFETDGGTVRALDGVDLDVRAGETVAVVGESGSGKSTLVRSITGLVDPPGRIEPSSSVRFRGEELVGRDDRGYEAVRGGHIGTVFQDAAASLNPVYTVGNQIEEALWHHRGLTGAAATEAAADLLGAVSVPDPRRRLRDYPHQFSGGMCQRVAIAVALAARPDLLLCDEPTTGLDAPTQAGILDLLADLQADRDLGVLFVTHDMGVVAEVADRVAVLYAGEVVERAPVEALFADPAHPYTRGLLASIPARNPDADRLPALDGSVPTPTDPPSCCRFAPRCPEAFDACRAVHPESIPVGDDRAAACLLYPADEPRERAVEIHRDGHDGRNGGTGSDDSRESGDGRAGSEDDRRGNGDGESDAEGSP